MNNFLKYVPGFRSNKTWKKVIACIYYFIAFTALFADKGVFLLLISAPFFIFSIIDLFKAKKNDKSIKAAVTMLIISLIVTSAGFAMVEPVETDIGEKEEPAAVEEVGKEEPKKVEKEPEKPQEPKKEEFEETRDLKIHYIDVGQGDSILVQLPNGETALIDGGPTDSSDSVAGYLKKQEVEKIDYLIATHPHEDHIGGLPKVIKDFEIGNIYMPNKTHTTKAFENLLLAIQDKGKKFKTPVAGDMLLDKEGLNLAVLAPEENTSGDNLNNYSIVLKLTYKDNSFLFTGDIEAETEQVMLNNNYDLNADVLKVAHHGSKSSTTDQFIDKVNPRYAVISCGKDNQYGHPHQEVVGKLTGITSNLYRTDENGTIVIISNGETLKIDFKKSAEPKQENAPPKEEKQSTESTKNETSKDNSQSKQSSNQNVSSSGNGTGGSGGSGNSGSGGGGNAGGGNSGNTGSSGSVSKPPATNPEPITSSYLGNSNTGKFHHASCRHAKKIASHNRVNFNSRDEAINNGYVPCKVCKP
ncbi:MAG TPA: MBL fold metallo-hydrolase [Tissierellia bacterium]|nr:MBL fold metallo-hydrolase [Tissierellia bacterium]